jgi:hypothetical protein
MHDYREILEINRVASQVRAELDLPKPPPDRLGRFWVHALGDTLWIDDRACWRPSMVPRLRVEFGGERPGPEGQPRLLFRVIARRGAKLKDYGLLERSELLDVAQRLRIDGLDPIISKHFGR